MCPPKVSVIVPIYNTEKYLAECIDSILAQSFQDFEVILVDDGSNDESGRICDDYAGHDHRVRVIHQQNRGANQARWQGLQETNSEWVCFVDADDTIPTKSLETLMSATGSNTDIVVARCDDRKMPDSMSLEEYRRCCIAGRKVHSGPVARVFRSRLFSSQTFDIPREIVMGEDYIMNVRYSFAMTQPPLFINQKVYNYRMVSDSIMHTNIHTMVHACRFLNEIEKSIPIDAFDYYRKDLNYIRWRSLALIVYDNPQDGSWKDSNLYKKLLDEIKNGHFAMTFLQKILLCPWNSFSRKVIYKVVSLISQ